MFASILCALHCSAVPVFISLGLVSGAGHSHNHLFDLFLAFVGLVIAIFTLVKDYNIHKSATPLITAFAGFTILFGSLLFVENVVLNIVGGLTITAAHFLNLRQQRHGHFKTA